ncbi:hypothetical protein NMY22_g19788 [Coprinellus aureogranulatus]|nr:hypothetical protein NMY22_g19788 [Coprinellus aureogranulatus]
MNLEQTFDTHHYDGRDNRFTDNWRNLGVGGTQEGTGAAQASSDDPGGVGGHNTPGGGSNPHQVELVNPASPTPAATTPQDAHGASPSGMGRNAHEPTLRVATLQHERRMEARSTIDKWDKVNGILRDNSLNILALEETHLTQGNLQRLQDRFSRMRIINSADPLHPSRRGGIAFVINKHNTNWRDADHRVLVPGRAILLTLHLNDSSDLNILAVYAPSGNPVQNADFWVQLRTIIAQDNLRVDIMLGDMNMVESRYDRNPVKADGAMVVEALQDLTTHLSMRDGWRVMNPNKLDFTFRTKYNTRSNVRSRLDRIYVTDTLLDRCTEWNIKETGVGSDHQMASVYITPTGTPFIGPGRSTFPSFLLDYDEVRNNILERAKVAESKILRLRHDEQQATRDSENNPQKVWKELKKEIMAISKDFSKRRVNRIEREIAKWAKRRDTVLDEIELEDNDDKRALLDEIDGNIENLQSVKLLRRKTNIAGRVHVLMDRGTAFDYNLRQDQRPRDTIHALKVPGSNPPRYVKSTSQMTRIMTEHHDNLQRDFAHDPSIREIHNG